MGFIHKDNLGASGLGYGFQSGVELNEGCAFLGIGLEKPFLRSLDDKSQTVEIIDTTTVAQYPPKVLFHKLSHHFPSPIRQFNSGL